MHSHRHLKYIGVFQVPVTNLNFIAGVGERTYNQKQINHLENLFRRTSINHVDPRHWIDGYIDVSEEASLLRDLNLTRCQIDKKNAEGEFPRIERYVAYTQGRHRVEAAKNIDASSCWTIRLYSTDQYGFRTNFIVKLRTEQYQHEFPHSDGEIYSKLREYSDEPANFHEWHERLSVTKQKAFFYINARPPIANALDRLIQVKAVMESLQLSCFLKIFDHRLDDELLAALNHIIEQWAGFATDNGLMTLEMETVRALEGRAPSVSVTDRNSIISTLRDRRTFNSDTNTQVRSETKDRVLATPGLIHGLKSLHMNMQHLCVAARVIWDYLIPRETRTLAKAQKMTLAETLQKCWTAEESYVEIREGVFQPAYGPPSFRLAYIQLLLSALRLFPFLTNLQPKIMRGEKSFLSIDPHCILIFHKRARFLGFDTLDFDGPNIDPTLKLGDRPWLRSQTTSSANEPDLLDRLDRRWGRPYKAIYQVIQTQAFLPTIERLAEGSKLSVAFILRDFILVFFGPCQFQLNYTRSPIYL